MNLKSLFETRTCPGGDVWGGSECSIRITSADFCVLFCSNCWSVWLTFQGMTIDHGANNALMLASITSALKAGQPWLSLYQQLLIIIIIIFWFIKHLRPWLQRCWWQVSRGCWSKALRKKYVLSLDINTDSESVLIIVSAKEFQTAQNNEKLVSRSLSCWTACPVVGRLFWLMALHCVYFVVWLWK